MRENDLSQRIRVRLANGLATIEPADGITAISLCGMGGETIPDLLDRDQVRLSGKERLILQPNGGEQPLRHWLMEHGYRILGEEVLRETASTTKSPSPGAAGRRCTPPRNCTSAPCNCSNAARYSWPSGSACCA